MKSQKRLDRSGQPSRRFVMEEDAKPRVDITIANRYRRIQTHHLRGESQSATRSPAVVHVTARRRPQIRARRRETDCSRHFCGLPRPDRDSVLTTQLQRARGAIVNRPGKCLPALQDDRVDFVVDCSRVCTVRGSWLHPSPQGDGVYAALAATGSVLATKQTPTRPLHSARSHPPRYARREKQEKLLLTHRTEKRDRVPCHDALDRALCTSASGISRPNGSRPRETECWK